MAVCGWGWLDVDYRDASDRAVFAVPFSADGAVQHASQRDCGTAQFLHHYAGDRVRVVFDAAAFGLFAVEGVGDRHGGRVVDGALDGQFAACGFLRAGLADGGVDYMRVRGGVYDVVAGAIAVVGRFAGLGVDFYDC